MTTLVKKSSCCPPGKTRDADPASPPKEDDMKEKLLASAALVLLACTPAMAQGLDEVKHKFASVSGIVQDKCMACHSRL